MFPNIDNKLGISAVRKALDSRSIKFPSTECIVDAIEICLQTNNCQFSGKNFVQKHGTAMGPKNACSYADLAMGLIDEKAKTGVLLGLLVLLLLKESAAKGTQPSLINCYSPEKLTGSHNCARSILTVSTKDVNLGLKIASVTILN